MARFDDEEVKWVRSLWKKSNGSGLFDCVYKHLHRSDSDGVSWRAGYTPVSFGTMPMQAQLSAQLEHDLCGG